MTTTSGWRAPLSAWAQLLWARGGALTVELADGVWVVPPDRALWLPARTPHHLHFSGRLALYAIHCNARVAHGVPTACCLVARTSLFAALCDEVLARAGLNTRRAVDRRLLGVWRDAFAPVARSALAPPMPRDPRAVRAAELMRAAATATQPLPTLARRSGASERTLARLFRRETGYGVGAWRRRAGLARAAALLAAGHSVTRVALEVGYDSTSAFVTAFKCATGVTPGRYAAPRNARGPAFNADEARRPPAGPRATPRARGDRSS
ncbi:MAG: AraC family transcriptional regulator [Gemmatimonadaceae bacterium]|nr:AraC family transcriptional regulator [Gemmatimonadaceae bacterium]